MASQEEKKENAGYATVPSYTSALKLVAGFARRYFVLRESGILSYSISPKHPVRDQIAIPHAALSTAVGRKDIHVDSSNATFHIKCFTIEDFNTWMAAFSRRYANPQQPVEYRDSATRIGTDPVSLLKTWVQWDAERCDPASRLGTSPLPATAEDRSEELLSPSRFSTALTRRLKGASSISSLSDGSPVEWFDAQDNVGEEFVLEEPTPDEERGPIILQTSFSGYKEYEGSSSDEDEVAQHLSKPEPDLTLQARQVARRTCLPCGLAGDEGSLFTMLKRNVGKDLSTITFPVSFNEPLTMLQQVAEEMEYHELLQQAVNSKDPVERICFIAAFAVSGYAHTRHRSGRKGFNPMLAETFEDTRMRFIAEKVSHNPVVVAYHAEGNGWQLDGKSAGRTKFWGKSLEVIPLGAARLKIEGDIYEWQEQAIVVYTKSDDGDEILRTLRQDDNQESCAVMSPSGEVRARIEGKWDEQLALALDPSHLHVLWRISPFPKQALDYYGFTAYAITLNEITSDLEGKLPPTDSRLRPDVRALEEGNVDLAEEEKTRLEELQRERRRRGAEREPRWFKQAGEDWLYVGGYWETRAKGWRESPVEPLW
ncbi:hypothetical protein EDD16DRAFT_1890827 [Pisolithus croceorrhizus]|nr:hypothetical protein EDD16DRAFT_1890827 [Pisolithus croceorrhizus]